jgi:hypothetical protein
MNVEWDIQFRRKTCTTWIAPGYHSEMSHLAGRTVVSQKGIRARVERVEFHLVWRQMTTAEKKQIKDRFGQEAKQTYHQFTRVTLKRLICSQALFPAINWYDGS